MQISEIQLEQVRNQIRRVKNCGNPYYEKKFSGINPEDIVDQQSFQKLPFSTKQELRDAYPLGLAAVPEEQIVRIHSSSATAEGT